MREMFPLVGNKKLLQQLMMSTMWMRAIRNFVYDGPADDYIADDYIANDYRYIADDDYC
jgi:hypothetical protein